MCGSDGLSSSSSLLICGKSCRCQAENPLNALPSFTRPALLSICSSEISFVCERAEGTVQSACAENWVAQRGLDRRYNGVSPKLSGTEGGSLFLGGDPGPT